VTLILDDDTDKAPPRIPLLWLATGQSWFCLHIRTHYTCTSLSQARRDCHAHAASGTTTRHHRAGKVSSEQRTSGLSL